ncbi:hypothetical protein BDW02DRAFT_564283, partial [Decorospora gaudefroyi]
MDFSTLPPYPLVANTQYSPNSEAFPSPELLDTYLTEPYTEYPFGDHHSLNGNSYYCHGTQSLDTPPSWRPIPKDFTGSMALASTASGAINTRLNAWSDLNPTSLRYRAEYNDALNTADLSGLNTSPLAISSSSASPTSPCRTPELVKKERPSSISSQPPPPEEVKPAPRKRGRPRLNRHISDGSVPTTSNNRVSRSQCVPHTEVERKYREKLNMELERLRRAVPILPQSDSSDIMGAAKPS